MQASRSSADVVRQIVQSQMGLILIGKVDRPITDGLNTELHLDIGNGVSLEKVDKFCYLGDILDADGGCDSAVTGCMFHHGTDVFQCCCQVNYILMILFTVKC